MWVRAFASSTSSWATDLSIQLMKPDFWFFRWVRRGEVIFFFVLKFTLSALSFSGSQMKLVKQVFVLCRRWPQVVFHPWLSWTVSRDDVDSAQRWAKLLMQNSQFCLAIYKAFNHHNMAESASGQGEANPAVWLATRAVKMGPACLSRLGFFALVPKEKVIFLAIQ